MADYSEIIKGFVLFLLGVAVVVGFFAGLAVALVVLFSGVS